MKKKLASILMAIVCVFAIGFCALACGAESELNGTWYMWSGGQKISSIAYEFEDGDVLFIGAEVGEYKVDDKDVTISIKGSADLKGKIVADGIIEITGVGEDAYFCIDGKTPPAAE